MRILFKFFLVVVFFTLPNFVSAENKIVFIDIEKIMTNSKAGKSISKQLEKIHKGNIDEFLKGIETPRRNLDTSFLPL